MEDALETGAAAVREALIAHGFTADNVLSRLGADAFAALGRGEPVPARHVLADVPDEPLTDLIRLFLLAESVPADRSATVLPLPEATALGLIGRTQEGSQEHVRGRVHIHPYPSTAGDRYVVSDFPATVGRALKPAHVIGVGGASVTLATITPRTAVASTLDLGTGCGIQAVLAAGHSARVVATDRSERALHMASITAQLSDVALDLRAGSLFEPVRGEEFDLVVANPPFVISPHARFTYREAPLRADDLCRTVVTDAAQHLRTGGVAVILANWLHTAQESWRDRLAAWAAPSGCQVWAAQREYLTPPEYVEVWLRDSAEHGGPDYEQRYAEWLTYFDELGATGVGFGWIALRRSSPAWFVAEDLSDAQRQPSGDELVAQLDNYSALHESTAVRLLSATPRWTEQVELHHSRRPTGAGSGAVFATGSWRPSSEVDPQVAALISGTGPLVQRIEEQAGGDPDAVDDLTARALIGIRHLIGAGLVSAEG